MNTEHPADRLTPRQDTPAYETDTPVLYAVADGIASLTMNRPQVGNAQNSQMTYALDATSACAGAGTSCPSRRSRWCRAAASPAG